MSDTQPNPFSSLGFTVEPSPLLVGCKSGAINGTINGTRLIVSPAVYDLLINAKPGELENFLRSLKVVNLGPPLHDAPASPPPGGAS